jgi:hypothetical protein
VLLKDQSPHLIEHLISFIKDQDLNNLAVRINCEENLLEPIEQTNTNEDDYQTHALQPCELIMEDEDGALRIGHKIDISPPQQ